MGEIRFRQTDLTFPLERTTSVVIIRFVIVRFFFVFQTTRVCRFVVNDTRARSVFVIISTYTDINFQFRIKKISEMFLFQITSDQTLYCSVFFSNVCTFRLLNLQWWNHNYILNSVRCLALMFSQLSRSSPLFRFILYTYREHGRRQ